MNHSLLKIFVVLTCVILSSLVWSATSEDMNNTDVDGESAYPESNCGVLSLCAIVRFLGSKANLSDVAQAVVSRQKGFSLLGLKEAAEDLGFHAYAVRITPEDLYSVEWPVITYMNELYSNLPEKHFVAVIGQEKEKLLVLDLPSKFVYFPIDRFTEYWDGETLVVSREALDVATFAPHAMENAQYARAQSNYIRIPIALIAFLLIAAGTICFHKSIAKPKGKRASGRH